MRALSYTELPPTNGPRQVFTVDVIIDGTACMPGWCDSSPSKSGSTLEQKLARAGIRTDQVRYIV